MEKSFKFESEKFPTDLEVVFEFSCTSNDDGSEITSLTIWNGDVQIEESVLDKKELGRIEDQAQEIADENSSDAYQSYLEGEGDRAYDAWKDRQMEDAND
jgi:hypothetical protein